MALPSNRSSSPSMLAGRTSPNSRNSEIANPVRRSFSGSPFSKPSIVANPRSMVNPITPANSPSDFPRRNSVSRENIFTSRDNEEKENGKDQSPIPVRVRSPTVGKSSKNFMSPTISAASKIAASPKKKILGDRNEPIRSSLSFSTMKSSSLNSVNPTSETSTVLESDTNPKNSSNPKSSRTVRFGGFEVISGSYDDSESTQHDMNSEMVTMADETDTETEIAPISNPKSTKTVKFVGFEAIPDSYDDLKSTYIMNPEIVTMEAEADAKTEVAPISNSAIAAAPPKALKAVSFDDLESPATNNFTEELDSVNLDPSFKISPVSSPMVVAPLDADPSFPPYDPKTNYLSPRPQFLHYRPNRRINRYESDGRLEELFSSAMVSESESDEASSSSELQTEEEDEEEIINVSEQNEAKNSSKPRFSRIFKISFLFLILFTACFSIHVVNVHQPHIFERASMLTMEDFHSSEVYEFAKTNFDVLVGKFEVWHVNSKSFISDVVFNIRGGRPLIYLNKTEFLHEDINVGQCLLLSRQTLWEEENSLNVVEVAMKEREMDIVEEPIERSEGQNEGEESLQEIEAMKEMETAIEPRERKSQNHEQEQEDESFQEIEAIKPKEIDIVEPVEISQNVEELEEGSFREIEVMKKIDFVIEPVEKESQNEEEVEEESYQGIEAEANDPKDIEEENDESSAESASEEVSSQEIIEEIFFTNSASDQLNEEELVQENKSEENCEVSSSPYFKIHDQIEQETATGETTDGENNDPMQENNTEFQYQSPPVSPPSEPQSDIAEENTDNDLIRTATDHGIGIPRDFTQKTAVIISAILLGLSLIIPAGLIYARKSGSGSGSGSASASSSNSSSMAAAIAETQLEKPLVIEKKIQNPPVVVQEQEDAIDDVADDDRDDLAGDFCSSETSSFQYSSMKGGETEEMKRSSEVQSHSHSLGRKTTKNSRRESMASSSLDEYSVSTSASPSYGSFTTYEKIPTKHGKNAEEEIATPVRRSSRIRKQYNS